MASVRPELIVDSPLNLVGLLPMLGSARSLDQQTPLTCRTGLSLSPTRISDTLTSSARARAKAP
eukprot:753378-Hanusia_phi.AAC.8